MGPTVDSPDRTGGKVTNWADVILLMIQTRPVPVPVTGTETDQAAWQQCNSYRTLYFSPFKMILSSLCDYLIKSFAL